VNDAQLRTEIAAAHGLEHRAAELLAGESVEELERSATALARLIDAPPTETTGDPLLHALSAGARAERKRQLAAIFVGRRESSPATTQAATPPPASTAATGAQPRRRKPETHEHWD
jgi:hypothetical protein